MLKMVIKYAIRLSCRTIHGRKFSTSKKIAREKKKGRLYMIAPVTCNDLMYLTKGIVPSGWEGG